MNTPRKTHGFAAVAFGVVVALALSGLFVSQASASTSHTKTVAAKVAPIPSAPVGMTLMKTQVVHKTDRLTEFAGKAKVYNPTAAPRVLARGTIGQCWETTATAVYDAPVGRLWSYTSDAIWCATRHAVTRFYWEPPDWTITSKGTLAGWHYKGHSTAKHKLKRNLRTGSDVGHFKRYYKACVLGKCVNVNLGSQDATHHLWVKPGGKHGWS